MTNAGPSTVFSEDLVAVAPGGPRLAVCCLDGERRPFLLVHGLASNARVWDGVARRLGAAGHRVVAVDLRGHGRSEQPETGYDTDTAADDLVAVAGALGLGERGHQAPVVVGQSWGGNVVLSLAARHPGAAAALVCVDGGWLRPRDDFATFEAAWSVLAPPVLDGVRYADVAARIRAARPDWPPEGVEGTLANLVELPGGGVRARLTRQHHQQILRSLYDGNPAAWYPRVDVPVLFVPAVGEHPEPGEPDRAAATRAAVLAALAGLSRASARWYPGSDHDLHAQHPDRLAADLENLELSLEQSVEHTEEVRR